MHMSVHVLGLFQVSASDLWLPFSGHLVALDVKITVLLGVNYRRRQRVKSAILLNH